MILFSYVVSRLSTREGRRDEKRGKEKCDFWANRLSLSILNDVGRTKYATEPNGHASGVDGGSALERAGFGPVGECEIFSLAPASARAY